MFPKTPSQKLTVVIESEKLYRGLANKRRRLVVVRHDYLRRPGAAHGASPSAGADRADRA